MLNTTETAHLQLKFSAPTKLDPALGLNTPDVESVVRLLAAVNQHLKETQGLSHYDWYTENSGENVRKKVAEGNTYIIRDSKGEIVATFSLGTQRHDYEGDVQFDDRPAFYLSMFCVSPSLQGQGIGKQIISQVETLAVNQAKEAGLPSAIIRFDARQEYVALMRFYEKLGYLAVGSVNEGENENYALLEKIIYIWSTVL